MNFFIIFLRLFFGLAIAFLNYSFLLLIFGSSLIQTSWIVLCLFKGVLITLVYFICYVFLFLLLVSYLKKIDSFGPGGSVWFDVVVVMLVLSGFPPFFLFLLKWMIFRFYLSYFKVSLLLLLISLLRFYFYFRFICISFFNNNVVLHERQNYMRGWLFVSLLSRFVAVFLL